MNLTRAHRIYEGNDSVKKVEIPAYDSAGRIAKDTGKYLGKITVKAVVNGLLIAGIAVLIKNAKIGKTSSAESIVSGVRMVADGLNRE